MTNPIDELKELEKRRSRDTERVFYTRAQFDNGHGQTYRRLALEVASRYEEELNLSEAKSQIINALNDVKYPLVIFSPSDPRVVVGREYEFSNSWDFRAPETAVLVEVNKYGDDEDFPFCFMDDNGAMPCRVFIRELPKEE